MKTNSSNKLFYLILLAIIVFFLYTLLQIGPQQQTTRQSSYQQSQFLGKATQTIISGTKKCTDTDGGDNQYLKGTAKYYSSGILQKTYTDSCYLTTLTEYYCNSLAYPQSKKVTCAAGCKDGACLQTTPNQNTQPSSICNQKGQSCTSTTQCTNSIPPSCSTTNNCCSGLSCINSVCSIPSCVPGLSTKPPSSPTNIQTGFTTTVNHIKQLSLDIATLSSRQGISLQTIKDKSQQRKKLVLDLMKKDPSAFLQSAMSSVQRQQLPLDIQQDIEKQTTITGKIEVFHIDDFKNPKNSKFEYFIKTENQRINFFPAGKEPSIISGATIRISGYQLDNNIAAQTDQNNFQVLQDAPQQETIGEQKTAVILLKYQTVTNPPYTKEQVQQMMFNGQIQKFYKEASYDKIYWSGDIYGWYTIPGECIRYEFQRPIDLSDNDIDFTRYQRIVLLTIGGCSNAGTVGKIDIMTRDGQVTTSIAWLSDLNQNRQVFNHPFSWTEFDDTVAHELGHNLGARHANAWDCNTGEILYSQDCKHYEYGNSFDIMGLHIFSLHQNLFHKILYNWLDPTSVLTITQSGRYSIKPLEFTSGIRGAIIKTQTSERPNYYLEYRRPIGFDSGLSTETHIGADPKTNTGLFINKGFYTQNYAQYYPRLLDMSPKYPVDVWTDLGEVTLNPGMSAFKDPGTGITIGPVISADENQITFDVKIEQPTCVPPEGY